jgi:hypothetical protein
MRLAKKMAMTTGTEIVVLAGTVASGFSILSINRGLKMRDDKRPWLIPGSGVMKTDGAALKVGGASK